MKQPTAFQNIQTRIQVTTTNYQKYLKLGANLLKVCTFHGVKFILQRYRYNSSSLCSRLKIILYIYIYLVFQIIRVPHSISHWGTPAFHPTRLKQGYVTKVFLTEASLCISGFRVQSALPATKIKDGTITSKDAYKFVLQLQV